MPVKVKDIRKIFGYDSKKRCFTVCSFLIISINSPVEGKISGKKICIKQRKKDEGFVTIVN